MGYIHLRELRLDNIYCWNCICSSSLDEMGADALLCLATAT